MELLNAVRNNDSTAFQNVLKQAASQAGQATGGAALGNILNAVDSDNNTPLNLAAQVGNSRMVKALLGRGADANIANNAGKTALAYAAQKQSLDMIQSLLSRGADPNLKDVQGNSALMDAIKAGLGMNTTGSTASQNVAGSSGVAKKIIGLFLKHGANVNTSDNAGNSPLILAAKGGATDLVKMLAIKGADLFKADNTGKTALQYAQEGNFGEIVTLISGLTNGSMKTSDLMSGVGGHMMSRLIGAKKEGGGSSKKCVIT